MGYQPDLTWFHFSFQAFKQYLTRQNETTLDTSWKHGVRTEETPQRQPNGDSFSLVFKKS